MKPDWDSLGSAYADSKTVVIGDVDCTASGKALCDKVGVRGYPTIKFYNPPDEEGEDYKGGRIPGEALLDSAKRDFWKVGRLKSLVKHQDGSSPPASRDGPR